MNPLKIEKKLGNITLDFMRALHRNDFGPVTEVSNAVHFILFEDDWDTKETDQGFEGELKISFKTREDILSNGPFDSGISPYIMDIVAVYKTKINAKTEDALEELKEEAEEKLYNEAIKKVKDAVMKIQMMNDMMEF